MHYRKVSQLCNGKSITNKVQHLSGFQNKVELLKMHIALLLRCSKKGLRCSAPSPLGQSTAELEYFGSLPQSVTNKVQNLPGFQKKSRVIEDAHCTFITLQQSHLWKRVKIFGSLPRGPIYCRIGVHARVLRGIFTNFS